MSVPRPTAARVGCMGRRWLRPRAPCEPKSRRLAAPPARHSLRAPRPASCSRCCLLVLWRQSRRRDRAAPTPTPIPTLKLKDGRVLHNVQVRSNEDDSIVVRADEGLVKVAKSNLPAGDRRRLPGQVGPGRRTGAGDAAVQPQPAAAGPRPGAEARPTPRPTSDTQGAEPAGVQGVLDRELPVEGVPDLPRVRRGRHLATTRTRSL